MYKLFLLLLLLFHFIYDKIATATEQVNNNYNLSNAMNVYCKKCTLNARSFAYVACSVAGMERVFYGYSFVLYPFLFLWTGFAAFSVTVMFSAT